MNAVELSGIHIGHTYVVEDESGTPWQGVVIGVEHGGLLSDLVKVTLTVGSSTRVYLRCRPSSPVRSRGDFVLAVAK